MEKKLSKKWWSIMKLMGVFLGSRNLKFIIKNFWDKKLAKQFSALVLQKIIEASYVKGAYNFITSNYQKYDFYISTGTPKDEIDIILEKKGIRKYFKDVYGSPDKKEKHIKEILKRNNLKTREILFIGDSITDRNAAQLMNVFFVGRKTELEDFVGEKYVIANLDEFQGCLESILNIL
jgi:phosphoglycolate phosphatase-like HAD superfamily hydrolase